MRYCLSHAVVIYSDTYDLFPFGNTSSLEPPFGARSRPEFPPGSPRVLLCRLRPHIASWCRLSDSFGVSSASPHPDLRRLSHTSAPCRAGADTSKSGQSWGLGCERLRSWVLKKWKNVIVDSFQLPLQIVPLDSLSLKM